MIPALCNNCAHCNVDRPACEEPLSRGGHWGEFDCPFFEPVREPSSFETYAEELEKVSKDVPYTPPKKDEVRRSKEYTQEDHNHAMDQKKKE